MGPGMMYGYGSSGIWGLGWGGVSMILMGVIPLVFVGLLVWLVVEATRGTRPEAQAVRLQPAVAPSDEADDPRLVLDRRYAQGEIDRDEYLRRRQDLS